MLENYGNLASLGFLITNPALISLLEQGEDPGALILQVAEERGTNAGLCTDSRMKAGILSSPLSDFSRQAGLTSGIWGCLPNLNSRPEDGSNTSIQPWASPGSL